MILLNKDKPAMEYIGREGYAVRALHVGNCASFVYVVSIRGIQDRYLTGIYQPYFKFMRGYP